MGIKYRTKRSLREELRETQGLLYEANLSKNNILQRQHETIGNSIANLVSERDRFYLAWKSARIRSLEWRGTARGLEHIFKSHREIFHPDPNDENDPYYEGF